MNFSKKGTVDKQKQIKSTKRKLTTKAGIFFFRAFLVCFVGVVIVGSTAGYGLFRGIIDNAPSIDSINVAPTGFISTIYDQEGKVIQTLRSSGANRKYIKLEKLPDYVVDAFVAIEDERFWTHNGIDPKGIFRAFFVAIKDGSLSQGASTITQQLLKNQVFEGGMESSVYDRIERKIQEQYLAIQLENKYSKEEIMEYYINTINLGQSTLGIQVASERYFNKSASKLTLSEAAVIAGITKNPTGNNPITNPENNKKRRNLVLSNMLNQEYITQEEYEEALEDDVYSRIQTVNEEKTENVYTYFIDAMIDQIIDDLQEKKGYSLTKATDIVYSGGLKIYSTQDTKVQKICDKVLTNEDYYPADSKWELTYRLSLEKKDGTTEHYSEGHLKNYFAGQNINFSLLFTKQDDALKYVDEYKNSVIKKGDEIVAETISFKIQPQISFVLIEQKTGEVKAIVGGRGNKEASRTLNRASNSKRQPGSTFKVLSTFLPALDTKGMTLATALDDSEYYYPDTKKLVQNANRSHRGLITMRTAIAQSVNVVTVKTLNEVTPQVGFDYLKRLGFSTIVESRTDENGKVYSDIGLPMALGGLTDGITNLELTAAFASIANNGMYTEPTFYTKIVDNEGKVLLENKPESNQIIKETTAWLLTNAMEDVVTVGTGKQLKLQKVDMPVAGKTGTTTNYNDLWFSGYTPYYTASIWSGYDNNGKQSNRNYHKDLWRIIMEEIHKDKKKKTFTKPKAITSAKICTKSGKLAVDGVCDHALGGSTVRTEYFAKGTVPTEKCDVHTKLRICKISKKPATKFCPESAIQNVVYLIKEETGYTSDTPYVLPKNLENTKCNVHSNLVIEPPEEETPPVVDPGEGENTGGEDESENNGGTEIPEGGDEGNIEEPEAPEPPPEPEEIIPEQPEEDDDILY